MRDIKSIRGDMFAHGVPFELVQELEEAIKAEPTHELSDKPQAETSEEDNERLCSAIDEAIIYDNIFKCWHIDRHKFAALRVRLAAPTTEKALAVLEDFIHASKCARLRHPMKPPFSEPMLLNKEPK